MKPFGTKTHKHREELLSKCLCIRSVDYCMAVLVTVTEPPVLTEETLDNPFQWEQKAKCGRPSVFRTEPQCSVPRPLSRARLRPAWGRGGRGCSARGPGWLHHCWVPAAPGVGGWGEWRLLTLPRQAPAGHEHGPPDDREPGLVLSEDAVTWLDSSLVTRSVLGPCWHHRPCL